METKITRRERIAGGLVGLLVGDALGVPYEFHAAQDLPAKSEIEYEPPAWFRRAHAGVAPGTWSDDGAQALCLLASLVETGRFDADDFAARLVRWFREDYMAVDRMFDVGIQTQRAILNLRKGAAPLEAGPSEEKNNGNGSLMRVLPLALWHRGTDAELVRDAFDQSAVTHGHLRSKVCCAVYCLWARRILENAETPWASALAAFNEIFDENEDAREELESRVFPSGWNDDIRGSGYVVDSLRAALYLNEQHASYEKIVKESVALGDDTDTTACIAGSIAGLRFGLDAIPARWRENLRGRELYEPLLEKLIG